MKVVTLKRIQRFVQNFVPYKMIYHLPRKFAFFAILRTFSPFTQEIYVEMANKIQCFIQNFMPYRMIYYLPRRFLNFRLRDFANIFVDYARKLR